MTQVKMIGKVCQVVSSLRTGGMERMVCDLMAGLVDRGIESVVFCTDAEGELYEAAPASAKGCGHRKPGLLIIDWRLVFHMVRFVKVNRVMLLHAHNHAPTLYCVLVSLLTGIPVIVTRHGQGYSTVRWKILTRLLAWRAQVVVMVSEDAKRVAMANHSAPAKKGMVIHNGVDTMRFAPRETLDPPAPRLWRAGHRLQTTDYRSQNPECFADSEEIFTTKDTKSTKGEGLETEGGGEKVNSYELSVIRNTNSQQPITDNNSPTALRERLGIPPDAIVIGSVGRLSPEKNYPLLVRSFAQLVQAGIKREGFHHEGHKEHEVNGGKEESVSREAAKPQREEVSLSGIQSAEGGRESVPFALSRLRVRQSHSPSDVCGMPAVVPTAECVGTEEAVNNFHILRSTVYGLQSTVFLILVGDGNDRGGIEAEMDRFGVRDRCHITGMVPDVRPWLGIMDVFCLSSDTEGLSISLLEAGACGLPCVVTDAGGNREIVKDGTSGFVVPVKDEAALAAGFKRLVCNAEWRHTMGQAARRLIEARFSRSAMVDGYLQIYANAIN